MNVNDMSPLKIELPEDVLKAKWCGDFDRANRLIDMMLVNPKVPQCLKDRLLIEKDILIQLPLDYVYPEEEAFKMCCEAIKDFTWEEFQNLIDTSAIDWIYVGGKLHACRRFLDTLLKVHPDLGARAGLPTEESEERKLLNQNTADMKANGKATWHIHLKGKFKINDEAFRKGEIVKVHYPIPCDAINMKNIELVSTSPECVKVGAPDEAQRTVYFETAMDENKPFITEFKYDSTVNYVNLDPEKASPVQPSFDTQEEMPHIRFTPFIKDLCAELKGDETNPVIVARKFYDYCTTNVTYSFMRQYFAITEIPEYAALNLKGDCGVQALLFITLCRCAGIPARWQSGVFVTPYDVGSHDWAMFYVDPYGWVFADPSFGGSAYRSGNKERHDFYFGNLDPFRMAANSVFQGALVPEKKFLRIDPYDNQKGEAEYADRGLMWNECDNEWEIVECRKVD